MNKKGFVCPTCRRIRNVQIYVKISKEYMFDGKLQKITLTRLVKRVILCCRWRWIVHDTYAHSKGKYGTHQIPLREI